MFHHINLQAVRYIGAHCNAFRLIKINIFCSSCFLYFLYSVCVCYIEGKKSSYFLGKIICFQACRQLSIQTSKVASNLSWFIWIAVYVVFMLLMLLPLNKVHTYKILSVLFLVGPQVFPGKLERQNNNPLQMTPSFIFLFVSYFLFVFVFGRFPKLL